MTPKKRILLILIVLLFFYCIFYFFLKTPSRELNFENYKKIITTNDNGLVFKSSTSANSISDFLKDKNIKITEHDQIIPEINAKIFSGSKIKIQRAAKIKIEVDGKTIETYALGKNIGEALEENNITLTRLDKTEPRLNFPVENNSEIIVTRINIEEKTEKEEIDFKTTQKTASKLGWREKKIETAGVKGVKEIVYKITYKNGKEISRIKLSQKILAEPVTQIEVQGTYMKLGGAAKGQGTWYAWKGGMFAASTTIPRGNYAKVTNTANGKSIVVQINDYGPQGKGRIIDLDKVAFAKIASLGAGVIGVKVEEVLN
ncbi:MAG: G5 domain-containing protein [bacterium]|nr:G5 domain-containing protein [bacterium]